MYPETQETKKPDLVGKTRSVLSELGSCNDLWDFGVLLSKQWDTTPFFIYTQRRLADHCMMVHELVPTFFELPAPVSYKDFFAYSYGSASLFLFQLVSSFKSCPFAVETACFSSTLHWHIHFKLVIHRLLT